SEPDCCRRGLLASRICKVTQLPSGRLCHKLMEVDRLHEIVQANSAHVHGGPVPRGGPNVRAIDPRPDPVGAVPRFSETAVVSPKPAVPRKPESEPKTLPDRLTSQQLSKLK